MDVLRLPWRPSRRGFLWGAGAAGLALLAGCGSLPWQAPAAPRIPRVGFLTATGPQPWHSPIESTLRELGYVPGQSVEFLYRYAEGDAARLSALLAELIAAPVDVLVVPGETEGRLARDATATVPIVLGRSTDPVGNGLVASLARPGGNVTGLTALTTGLSAKRLEILHDAVPSAARVVMIRNSANPSSTSQWRETEGAAEALGLQVETLAVDGPDGLGGATAAAALEQANGLLVASEPVVVSYRTRILELAAQYRLPAMYDTKEWVTAGGLISYGPDIGSLYGRAAYYVDRILKGTPPAELPVEQPTRFDFVVNLKTARSLGLTIPQQVLLQATEVLE